MTWTERGKSRWVSLGTVYRGGVHWRVGGLLVVISRGSECRVGGSMVYSVAGTYNITPHPASMLSHVLNPQPLQEPNIFECPSDLEMVDLGIPLRLGRLPARQALVRHNICFPSSHASCSFILATSSSCSSFSLSISVGCVGQRMPRPCSGRGLGIWWRAYGCQLSFF